MKYVQLGEQKVSVIGLGAWQFGSPEWGWGRDFGPDEARRVVHRALDLGITFFDTAELYGSGRSEEILGEALRGVQDVVVASKAWVTRVTPSAVVAATHGSLRRLGREAIDLYQIHWPVPVLPVSWQMRGMREILERGLVRQVGVSNFSLGRWLLAERSLGRPVVSNQVRYHLLDRQPERRLIPYAAQADRKVIAYSPIAQGLLAGGYGPSYRPGAVRAWNPLFWPDNLRRAQPVVEAVQAVARERGATPAQIALAWTIRDGSVVAIPGARRVDQVEENAAAADIDLTPEETDLLDRAAAAFKPALARSAASLLGSFVFPARGQEPPPV